MAAEENKVQAGSNSAETGKPDGDVSGNAEGPAAIVPESEKQAGNISVLLMRMIILIKHFLKNCTMQ